MDVLQLLCQVFVWSIDLRTAETLANLEKVVQLSFQRPWLASELRCVLVDNKHAAARKITMSRYCVYFRSHEQLKSSSCRGGPCAS